MTKLKYPRDIPFFKKGDRFTDSYCYWVYILKVTKNYLWIMSASAPCEFPKDGKVEKVTRKYFRERFYFVWLEDRGNCVKGWLKNAMDKS